MGLQICIKPLSSLSIPHIHNLRPRQLKATCGPRISWTLKGNAKSFVNPITSIDNTKAWSLCLFISSYNNNNTPTTTS